MTSLRWYLLGLLVLFGAFVALEYYRPRPLDWRPTYLSKDKIPYGGYVLFDQLPRLLGTDSVQVVRVAAFNQLTGIAAEDTDEADDDSLTEVSSADTTETAASAASDSVGGNVADTSEVRIRRHWDENTGWAPADTLRTESAPAIATEDAPVEETEPTTTQPALPHDIDLLPARANYLFIDEDIHLAPSDARALLRYVAQGHDVFIAAEDFGGPHNVLTDSLGFRSTAVSLGLPNVQPGKAATSDSTSFHFTHPQLRGATYRLPASGAAYRLAVEAGRRGATLATDTQGKAVLVRLDHGQGHFYLCSVPLAFTNYFVLQPRTTGFAAGALSYLPPRPAWWDEYEKTGPQGDQSLLRVLLDHEALRTALYLLLGGGLLFVLLEARRRQRIIPTIRPLPNTTLLFTRTVAGLYQQGSSHGLIAEKKVGLFLDYLRTRFQETNPDLGDDAFRERLARKSGLPRPRVDELLRLVNFARTAPQVTDRELLSLSRAINDFKHESTA
jgi:hypothetical protein